jgi:hypothetical protein
MSTKASKNKLQSSTAPVRLIGIADIHVGDRLRGLNADEVNKIAESMASVGQLAPIIIRRSQKSGEGTDLKYVLVAGLHRLKAAVKLGWERIQAREFVATGAMAWEQLTVVGADELIEIDENLCRADLSPAERADHIGRRKAIYERANPTTKHGAAPGKAGGGKKAKGTKLGSFAAATAKATGQSKTKIKRDAHRAKVLDRLLDKINGTSLDKGAELDALCRLPEEEQEELVARAVAGEQVSAREVLAAKKSGAKSEPGAAPVTGSKEVPIEEHLAPNAALADEPVPLPPGMPALNDEAPPLGAEANGGDAAANEAFAKKLSKGLDTAMTFIATAKENWPPLSVEDRGRLDKLAKDFNELCLALMALVPISKRPINKRVH